MRTIGKQLLDGAQLKPEDVAKQLGRKMHNYGDYQSFGDLIIETRAATDAGDRLSPRARSRHGDRRA